MYNIFLWCSGWRHLAVRILLLPSRNYLLSGWISVVEKRPDFGLFGVLGNSAPSRRQLLKSLRQLERNNIAIKIYTKVLYSAAAGIIWPYEYCFCHPETISCQGELVSQRRNPILGSSECLAVLTPNRRQLLKNLRQLKRNNITIRIHTKVLYRVAAGIIWLANSAFALQGPSPVRVN